jgi:hypothetical protein
LLGSWRLCDDQGIGKSLLTQLTVLAGASEPGGAKNIALVAKSLEGKGTFKICCSKGATQILRQTNLAFKQVDHIGALSGVTELLYKTKPTVILTGRGIQPNSLERLLVRGAHQLGIPSVGLIDEWYDYKANYSDESGSWNSLPSMICCPDEQAYQEAIEEGLPLAQLQVTGSPAFAATFDRRERFRIISPKRPSITCPSEAGPVIVFLSEIIHQGSELHSPPESVKSGHSDPGYTEHSVREDLKDILKATFRACTVIEKLHPSAQPETYSALASPGVDWRTTQDADLDSLFWWADLVVGMRSAALIEARLLGAPAISFQPNLIGKNRCTAVRKRLIPCFSTKNDLQIWLQNRALHSEKEFIARPEFAISQSVENIVSTLEQTAKRVEAL